MFIKLFKLIFFFNKRIHWNRKLRQRETTENDSELVSSCPNESAKNEHQSENPIPSTSGTQSFSKELINRTLNEDELIDNSTIAVPIKRQKNNNFNFQRHLCLFTIWDENKKT